MGAYGPSSNAAGPLVTPEAVRLDLEVVGIGSRSIAFLLDWLIIVAFDILLAVGLFATDLIQSLNVAIIVWSLVVLFNVIGYHLLFELAWEGQTPGKRQQKLRVVMVDGSTPTKAALIVRNLLRLVDVLPTGYALGVITSIVSKRSQRLGDLAAGTVVLRLRQQTAPRAMDLTGAALPEWAIGLDVSAVSDEDYALARQWLQRRGQLEPSRHRALGTQVVGVLRERVPGIPDNAPVDAVVQTVLAVVQRGDRPF